MCCEITQIDLDYKKIYRAIDDTKRQTDTDTDTCG